MKEIYKKILPDNISNIYKGSKIALYVFIIITAITIVRSFIHMFAFDGGAQSIAGFPIDSYASEAKALVILIFSLWGSSQLLMGFVYILVIWKYKSLIPLMYILIFLEYSMRILIGFYKPAMSTHVVPGGIADYIAVPLALVMLVLSLRKLQKTQ